MDKRTAFALAAMAAAVLTTLMAITPVTRAIGKISHDLYFSLRGIFLHHSLVALAVGIAIVGVAILLSERHRIFAVCLLVIAPVAAMLVGL